MKKWFRNLSYRNKLFITNMLIVLVVVIGITAITTLTTSRQALDSNKATLNLLTEQALINFSTEAGNIGRNIYALYSSTNTADQMNLMRNMDPADAGYLQARRELTQAVARMINSSAPYDHASVLLLNGDIVTGNPLDEDAEQEARRILSREEYALNAYGKCLWLRTEAGNLWCVRDVYCQTPLRRVGKMAVRIRQEQMASLGQSNEQYQCSLFFFDGDGQWLMAAGHALDAEAADQARALMRQKADTVRLSSGSYLVNVHKQGDWFAVGLLPVSKVTALQKTISRNGLLMALLGILFGLALATAVSHRLSSQVRRLVQTMDQVSTGDLDVEIPVESNDDIGMLTENFNRTTRKTKALLQRLVTEEANKRQAEYQNLEYEYRFLQWQINPHFIYNALETVNALAKLDGNPELSDMIVKLSAYFRANAEAMSQKYVTVHQEFISVGQYVEIYRHIYGSNLTAEFTIAPGAEMALVPTMILQPIMENALIHGNRGRSQNHISTEAEIKDGMLSIRIRDNGPGMTPEIIEKMLARTEAETAHNGRTSLGMRNVLERLRLLYGEEAAMNIESSPGEGTCVMLLMPCRYSEAVQGEQGQKTKTENSESCI